MSPFKFISLKILQWQSILSFIFYTNLFPVKKESLASLYLKPIRLSKKTLIQPQTHLQLELSLIVVSLILCRLECRLQPALSHTRPLHRALRPWPRFARRPVGTPGRVSYSSVPSTQCRHLRKQKVVTQKSKVTNILGWITASQHSNTSIIYERKNTETLRKGFENNTNVLFVAWHQLQLDAIQCSI